MSSSISVTKEITNLSSHYSSFNFFFFASFFFFTTILYTPLVKGYRDILTNCFYDNHDLSLDNEKSSDKKSIIELLLVCVSKLLSLELTNCSESDANLSVITAVPL